MGLNYKYMQNLYDVKIYGLNTIYMLMTQSCISKPDLSELYLDAQLVSPV